jgi:hypothetical protein
MSGEQAINYRRRLLKDFLPYSEKFKAIDLDLVSSGPLFDSIEAQVFADAKTASQDKIALNRGAGDQLRMTVRKDESGREIREFYGTPRSWMENHGLLMRPQLLVKVNNK